MPKSTKNLRKYDKRKKSNPSLVLEDCIDPALRNMIVPTNQRQDSVANQRQSSVMNTSISPQSAGLRSDESLATGGRPNTTRTPTPRKRVMASDESELGSGDEEGESDADIMEKGRKKIARIVEKMNKRFKRKHIVVHVVKSTRPDDPIPASSNTLSAYGPAGDSRQSSGQATQEHKGHQASRPSLSSTLSSSPSNVGNQIPRIFSPQERPLDSQSMISEVTAQSISTRYQPGGKACLTCIKLLTGSYVSLWKHHFWPTHCPQEGFYCLYCKLNLIDENGTLYWQCGKCLEKFSDGPSGVAHFTDRTLPCFNDRALWVRAKPWKDHLQSEFIVDNQCRLCQATFSNKAQSQKHKCPKTSGWKYQMLTPLPKFCEDHPGTTFNTFEQVNEHYENEHFKKLKASSARARQRNGTCATSTQGSHDSRLDSQSQYGNDPQSHGHAVHDCIGPGTCKHLHPTIEGQHLQSEPFRNSPTDWQEPVQSHELRDHPYPPLILMEDEAAKLFETPVQARNLGPQEGPDPAPVPPVFLDPVAEDGDPKFFFR